MLARLLTVAASVALLAASPAVGVGTFTYSSFSDATCTAAHANGVVTVAAVDGSCQPLVSTDPAVTPATILGITGLTYGKVYCNSATGVNWIEGFSDAGCNTKLGMRSQTNGTCVGHSTFSCSDANATPAPTVPANYQVRVECEGTTDCTSSSHCITSALPANTCVGLTERVAPLQRSEYVGCNGPTGAIENYVYLTPDCTGDAFIATKVPNNVCKTNLKMTCSAPAAASPPTFPTIAQGYSINTRQCTDTGCSTDCLVDARKLQTCFSMQDEEGTPQGFINSCVVGGAQTITSVYTDVTCAAANLNFGAVDRTDATCQGMAGTTSCPLNAAYPPVFAGSLMQWRNVLGCPVATPPSTDALIPALNTCLKFSSTASATLAKSGANALYTFFPNGDCTAGPGSIPISGPDGQCITFGQGPDSGIISTTQRFPSAPPSVSFKRFFDDRCDATAAVGEVTIAVADGTCQPLTVVSGGSAAAVFGLTNAVYGRAWCGPNQAAGVQIQAFSDAGCATMLGARMQLNSNCADSASVTCSYLNPAITSAPAFPPATFTELKVCAPEAQCTGDSCASLALPTNKCVGITAREAPITRSMMMLCVGDGSYRQFDFDTPNCSGATAFASILPLATCKGPLKATCPAAQQPMPTPVPSFPTVDGGYAITRRSCDDDGCLVNCAVDAFPLAQCRQFTDRSGLNSMKASCVNGGTGVVRSIYGGGTCASGSLEIGTVDPVGASCKDPRGAITCSTASPYADGPNFSGFVQRFRGTTTCAGGAADTTLYPLLNTCAGLGGGESIRLDCSGNQATDSYWNQSTTCAGPAHASHSGAANTCLVGDHPNESVILGCHNLFPGSLRVSKYHDFDDQCHSGHLIGTVTIAKADGSCQPLVSTDPNVSPATILGLTSLAYARAWCGGNSNEVLVQGYSDAACNTMLGGRRQINTVCADHQMFTCSKLDAGLTPPAFPPATYAAINVCPPGSHCQSSDCAVSALPVNQCIGLTSPYPPLLRSQMMVCAGDGTHKLYNYLTPDCSGAVFDATQVDSNTCYDVFSATCPSQQQPMPSPVPSFPTQNGGYLIHTRACNSASCNTGCMISATQMATCHGQPDFGSFATSNKLVCVSAGTALVDVQYNDGTCNNLAFGNVVQQMPGATCTDAFGTFSCSTQGQNGNLPAFAGSVSKYGDSTNCSTAHFPADIKLLPTLNTCTNFANFSYELDCDSTAGTAMITEWDAQNCAGTGRMHMGAQDTCIAVTTRDGHLESIRLDCTQMFPSGTGSGAVSTIAAKSVASVLVVIGAIFMML